MDSTNGQDSPETARGTPRFAARTDQGLVRPSNQDTWHAAPAPAGKSASHGHLFIVADGMGGHAAGEVASRVAVETVREGYYQAALAPGDDPARVLRAVLEEANRKIQSEGLENRARRGMGTTCTVALIRGTRLWLAHVGDSRAYLFRRGSLRQLTVDHNLAAELLAEGRISSEEAAAHSGRHVLTRALGVFPKLEPDVSAAALELLPLDRLLLCSDGLTRVVTDEEIADAVGTLALEEALARLIEAAKKQGGPDNITIVLVELPAAEAEAETR